MASEIPKNQKENLKKGRGLLFGPKKFLIVKNSPRKELARRLQDRARSPLQYLKKNIGVHRLKVRRGVVF